MIDIFAFLIYVFSATWLIRIILNALKIRTIDTNIIFLVSTVMLIVTLYLSTIYLRGLAIAGSFIIFLMMGFSSLNGPAITDEYSRTQKLLSILIVLSLILLNWVLAYTLIVRT